MKEAWLFQGAVVPVDMETTQALVAEIKRLIDVVGGMALAQRTWVGLTDEEIRLQWSEFWEAECHPWAIDFAQAIEAKLRSKNNE
jgi:hypothetical protein